jgi:hypothetical protein
MLHPLACKICATSVISHQSTKYRIRFRPDKSVRRLIRVRTITKSKMNLPTVKHAAPLIKLWYCWNNYKHVAPYIADFHTTLEPFQSSFKMYVHLKSIQNQETFQVLKVSYFDTMQLIFGLTQFSIHYGPGSGHCMSGQIL